MTAARNVRIANLNQEIFKRDGQISDLNRSLDERAAQVDALNQSVREILDSTSWRLSAPVRFVGRLLRPMNVAIRALRYAISASGGYRALSKNVWGRYKDEGIDGITRRIVFSASVQDGAAIQPKQPAANNDYSEWVRRYDTISDADREKIRTRIDQMAVKPLISIVMPVYNPPLAMLEQAIRSVETATLSTLGVMHRRRCIDRRVRAAAPSTSVLRKIPASRWCSGIGTGTSPQPAIRRSN